MKNLRQKSSIFSITLFIALLIGASCNILAQNEVTSEVSEFQILVETNDGGIRLTCKEGCAWKELTFNISETEKAKEIDEYGMTSSKANKNTEESNLANFLISISKTKVGFAFEGIEGTSWKNLNISCSNNNCYHTIDQNGMTKEDE